MPEEIEVDTDKLREKIDEEIEAKEGGAKSMLRLTALSTAVLAALAAIASLKAGATVNDAILLQTEATGIQARASDQWAYYQAKGIKGTVTAASAATYHAAGKTPPASLDSTVQRYANEQKAISDSAKELEHQRDEKIEEADHLMAQHKGFAIAVGAVAALTRSKGVLGTSLGIGVLGAALFVAKLFG